MTAIPNVNDVYVNMRSQRKCMRRVIHVYGEKKRSLFITYSDGGDHNKRVRWPAWRRWVANAEIYVEKEDGFQTLL